MSHTPETERPVAEASIIPASRASDTRAAPPSRWQLLCVWLALGVQSFGGGTATLYLIRRAVVERHGWLSDEEFTRDWAICQIVPGINLLGLTTLIGWKLAGALGVALSLLGLLLPSVAITVLLTALYTSISGLAVVRAALRGVIPATAGLGLLLALKLAQPILAESRREGRASLAVSCAVLLASGALMALWSPPVVGVLWGAGVLVAVAGWRRAMAAKERSA